MLDTKQQAVNNIFYFFFSKSRRQKKKKRNENTWEIGSSTHCHFQRLRRTASARSATQPAVTKIDLVDRDKYTAANQRFTFAFMSAEIRVRIFYRRK